MTLTSDVLVMKPVDCYDAHDSSDVDPIIVVSAGGDVHQTSDG